MEINIKMCSCFKDRLLGLMFKKEKIDYCLCFPKCNSVHTFFMMQNIDIIMTDKNNKIIYIFNSVKPWKIILPKKGIYFTYEFRTNHINPKIGDYLKIKS